MRRCCPAFRSLSLPAHTHAGVATKTRVVASAVDLRRLETPVMVTGTCDRGIRARPVSVRTRSRRFTFALAIFPLPTPRSRNRETWEVQTTWEGRGMSASSIVPFVQHLRVFCVRNFVKARARDATGKAQRNHFGKQRLGILMKGLSKARPEVLRTTDITTNVASSISLAHAQRDLRTQTMDNSFTADDLRLHSTLYTTPTASRLWHTSDSSSNASNKSRNSRRSKILNALDMSVRMSP